MATLVEVANGLSDAVADPSVRHELGRVCKTAALETAETDLGGDRAFSGFRRKVPLNAGYDLTRSGITLNLRPEGLWLLADEGVKSSGVILPRRARRRRRRGYRPAVGTPRGPRYISRYRAGAFRGFNTLTKVEKRIEADVPDQLGDYLYRRLAEV